MRYFFVIISLIGSLQIVAQTHKSDLSELAGNKLIYADSTRILVPWPVEGKIRVIIDSDAANEVDDQFAIALALGYPERLQIEGFVAAHYGLRGGSKGIEKSRKNILELLDLARMKDKFTVKNGSDPLVYLDRVPDSEGVDFIIEKAKTATPENPIWVVALGPATNAAAAILKDPTIADRLVILWHGRSKWPTQCWNFNAYNDIKAVQVLFDLPVRLILFDTGTYLTMPMSESEKRVMPNGKMGKYLHDIRKRSVYASRADKGLFDMGDIVALIDHRITKWEIVDAPSVGHDLRYDFKTKRGKFIRIFDIDRDASFKLLDEALTKLKN
jgi:purine nucleosidase